MAKELRSARRTAEFEDYLRAFSANARLPGIAKVEEKLRKVWRGEASLWPAAEEQLLNWAETKPDGRHAGAIAPAQRLLGFLQQRVARATPSDSHPLIELACSSRSNDPERFVEVAESLTAAEIARLFAAEKEQAPRRHGAGLAYFVGHTGVPSNDASTNRHEEHLAIALFREFGPSSDGMALPESGRLRLLDYQVPLEQRRADRGVGKVDLFGVDSSSTPWVIELKVKRSGRQDTPLRGLLQALAYCAALESNLDEISSDA
jgi:hypothetical protein